MSLIRIPERFESGFELFFGLNPAEQQTIIDYLKSVEPGISFKSIIEGVHTVGTLRKEEMHHVVGTLYSLYSALDESEFDIELFVEELTKAVKSVGFSFDEELFATQFQELLASNDAYQINRKINSLIREKERLATGFRIISDIRPIVDDDNPDEILGMTITHNLRINFREDGELKRLFFAIDSEDLDDLKGAIIRAEKKEKNFKRLFEKSGQRFFDLK